MISITLLSLVALVATPTAIPETPFTQSVLDEVDDAIRAAGEDVAALLKLAERYEKSSKKKAAEKAYTRVIELDSENEQARKALRHQKYDGRWFESYVDLARYKREESARMKEKGLARWEDEWVPLKDLPFLRMGWERDANQVWCHPAELERAKQIAEWKAAGYQYRADDNSWIAPEDVARWTALEWKCGDEWFDMDAANRYHADPKTPWEVAGEHFIVRTTCGWNYGNAARWHADRVHAQLVRLFGVAPTSKPTVLMLSSLTQYNAVAADDMVDSEGFSSLHGAYFSDAGLDDSVEPPRFNAMGVSYWAGDDSGVAGWGPFWLRWAAAQSFIESIDPSWGTAALRAINEMRSLDEYTKAYWESKRIPRWLRYGAASYVERFLANPEAAEGADPWDLRSFALVELKKNGGLRELPKVFAFELTLEDIPGSAQLYSEAGLLVSFLLDGAQDDAELQGKLAAFRKAFASGSKDEVRAASKSLEAALIQREAAIREYAGL